MNTNSTGLPGYRGYEYQIVVSVWVALDLMLVRRLCNMIEIEPATQEDIAAKPGAPAETAESKLNISFREERFSI